MTTKTTCGHGSKVKARGANEIGSCMLEFLKTQNLSAIEHVKTFSDCCGGQNRNRTMISFMMWACWNFDLKSWEHRFMEPGHSYLPNDSDFRKIEGWKALVDYPTHLPKTRDRRARVDYCPLV
ncbi:hypothetical protein FHG87_024832 [Trinorchestia longiramus]|nr:hypothetical protein FHG87_024832 [Trinorchestia longiramus]